MKAAKGKMKMKRAIPPLQLLPPCLVLQRDIAPFGFLRLRFNILRVRFRWEQYAA
jgi:hypothetical protein